MRVPAAETRRLATAHGTERSAMTARPMWKASLRLGRVDVPVKLYAAVEEHGIHFRLLEARTRQPVQQRMIDPRTEEEVPPEAVRRGVEVERGVFVLLDEKELAATVPEPSRDIEIVRTVPSDAIDPAWYVRPYYLGPDGSAPRFAALVQALEQSALRGVARWSMRRKRYTGALAAHGSHLVLLTLRAPEEVVAREIAAPDSKAVTQAERKLADQLVAALDAPFDPEALRDEYGERVEAFARAKARGRSLHVARESVPRASGDLARALERSVASLRQKHRAA